MLQTLKSRPPNALSLFIAHDQNFPLTPDKLKSSPQVALTQALRRPRDLPKETNPNSAAVGSRQASGGRGFKSRPGRKGFGVVLL
jgi:hypothetical protein